ncbi:conserved hypothetical protein [Escherichia coli O26:H11]|nr:conserved hypothetical protein [Escherichia coli O26:H11]CUW81456.1 conserved hypothetical protein [Escherichia coli]CUX81015.1 conserved hypothetical protein [Escherichia coli]
MLDGNNNRMPVTFPCVLASEAYITLGLGAGCNLKTRDGRVNEKLSPFTSSFLRNTCPLAGLRQRGVI